MPISYTIGHRRILFDLPTPQGRGLRQQYDLSDDWSDRLETLIPAFENFLPCSNYRPMVPEYAAEQEGAS